MRGLVMLMLWALAIVVCVVAVRNCTAHYLQAPTHRADQTGEL